MNDETKNMLLSKTLWGIVIACIAQVLARKGVTIDAAAWTNDAISIVGALLGIYGRFTAKTALTVAPTK